MGKDSPPASATKPPKGEFVGGVLYVAAAPGRAQRAAPLRREMREGCATLAKHLSSEQGGQFGLDCRLNLALEGKRDERERDFNSN